jgi:hypothetical protein
MSSIRLAADARFGALDLRGGRCVFGQPVG